MTWAFYDSVSKTWAMYRYKIWTACDFIAKMTSFKKKMWPWCSARMNFLGASKNLKRQWLHTWDDLKKKTKKKTVFCTESHYLGDHLLVISFCTEGHFWALRWSPKKMSSLESHHFLRLLYIKLKINQYFFFPFQNSRI